MTVKETIEGLEATIVDMRESGEWESGPMFLSSAIGHLRRMEGIVSKLPVTADGVSIVPGMTVYSDLYSPKSKYHAFEVDSVTFCGAWSGTTAHTNASRLYSTSSAALAPTQSEVGK